MLSWRSQFCVMPPVRIINDFYQSTAATNPSDVSERRQRESKLKQKFKDRKTRWTFFRVKPDSNET